MKNLTPALSAAAALVTLALAAPPIAHASAIIGLDPTGGGGYTTYADLWTSVTNTAMATGFIPGLTVGGNGLVSTLSAPYVAELRSQMVIGTMSRDGGQVTPPTLNSGFELSAVVRFQEWIDQQTPTSAHFTMPSSQSAAMDVDPLHAGVQNIAFYLDRLGPGGASAAVPGNGADTVRCYGAGSTSAGCGGPGDPDGDGIMIMSGHLVYNEGHVSVNTVATGAFDMRFEIDYVNGAYLDLATGAILQNQLTGTANIPTFYTPATMWDGTTSDGTPLLKFDGSPTFLAPEPGTLALAGLGLAGLALGRRRGAAA